MRQAVIGIVYHPEKKDSVLLVKRRDIPIWVLPGGGVDDGENPVEAVTREIFEETGIKTSVKRLAALYSPANSFSELTHVFECEPLNNDYQNFSNFVSSESSASTFTDLQNIDGNFFYIHSNWLKEIKNCNNLPIKRKLYEVNILSILKYFLCHPLLFLRYLFTRITKPR